MGTRWRELSTVLSERLARLDKTDLVTAGRLRTVDNSSFLVVVQGHRDGIVVSREFPFLFSGVLSIPWRMVRSITVLPSRHTGKLADHTHAILRLDVTDSLKIQIPWHRQIERLVPENVFVHKE